MSKTLHVEVHFERILFKSPTKVSCLVKKSLKKAWPLDIITNKKRLRNKQNHFFCCKSKYLRSYSYFNNYEKYKSLTSILFNGYF